MNVIAHLAGHDITRMWDHGRSDIHPDCHRYGVKRASDGKVAWMWAVPQIFTVRQVSPWMEHKP